MTKFIITGHSALRLPDYDQPIALLALSLSSYPNRQY
jgi:hypothetical protein